VEELRADAAQSEIELVCLSSAEAARPECRRDQHQARRVYEDFLREEADDSIGLEASNVCLYKWSNYLDESSNYVAVNDCLRDAIKVYRKPVFCEETDSGIKVEAGRACIRKGDSK
jgi:hypothetical protein